MKKKAGHETTVGLWSSNCETFVWIGGIALDVVRRFVVENFLYGEDGDLRDDTSFLEEGIVDSTGVLELVAFLEEHFGITVEDEEVVPENLDSLQNIARFLSTKLNTGGPEQTPGAL
jgi:acyl carrier protein